MLSAEQRSAVEERGRAQYPWEVAAKLAEKLANSGPMIEQVQFLELVEEKDNVIAMSDFIFRPDSEQYTLTTTHLLIPGFWLGPTGWMIKVRILNSIRTIASSFHQERRCKMLASSTSPPPTIRRFRRRFGGDKAGKMDAGAT